MRAVPQAAVDLAKSFEKCELVCFDSDGSGTPTIGWGSTRGLTRADIGKKTITQEAADALFDAEFRGDAAKALYDQIEGPAITAMTDNQYGAMVDFCFNEGTIGPTLKGLLNARRFDAVPPAISAYVYAKQPDGSKKKLFGLVRRRNAEVELWSTDEPGTLSETPASSILRDVSTPPAVAPGAAIPLHRQNSFLAACTTAICAGGAAAQPVISSLASGIAKANDQLTPYAANAHVASIQTMLVPVMAILSVVTLVLLWLKHRAAVQESDGAPNNVASVPWPAKALEGDPAPPAALSAPETAPTPPVSVPGVA